MKKPIILLIFLTTFFATWIYLNLNKPDIIVVPNNEVPINTPAIFEKENCTQYESDIKTTLEKANYCNEDKDCEIVSLGCPFGCYKLVNVYSDIASLKSAGELFQEKCTTCIYDCDRSPTKNEVKCISNKCTDTRYIQRN